MARDIHIGQEIEQRLKACHMSKNEFAHRLGMPQQNINRILRGQYIMTDKLIQISSILQFDFFSLYQESDKGDINVVANGDSSIAALNSEVNTTDISVLVERIKSLEKILFEKERIIQILMSKVPR